MFFKKNKPAPPPEAEHQALQQEQQLSGGQSLFAPSLNPNPAPVDFGFGSFPSMLEGSYQGSTMVTEPWQPSSGPALPTSSDPESWRAPSPPEPEQWMMPLDPTVPMDISAFPVIPELTIESTAPPWESALHQSLIQANTAPPAQASPADLTPEQAWSMLEPAPAALPIESELETWEYNPPNIEPVIEAPAQTNVMQEDWTAAFEEPPAFMSSAPPSFVPPPIEPPFLGTETGDLQESWAYPAGLSPEAQAPSSENDFGLPAAPEWSVPAPEAFLSETSSSLEAAWADESSTPEAVSLDAPEPFENNISATESWAAFEVSPSPENDMETAYPESPDLSLEAAWAAPTLEETVETLPSYSPPPMAQEASPQPWVEMGPFPELTDFSTTLAPEPQAPIPQTDLMPEFDPIKASQELAAGWTQMEKVAPEPLMSPDSALFAPPIPQENTWADENIPAPAASQSLEQEWNALPSPLSEPVYLHDTPAQPHSEEQLWNNLSTPEATPGEQVPLASGGLIDAINEQLYPEDPFSALNGEFAAGEQAFAEAAQFLFPETMTAPIDWADSGYGASDDSEHDLLSMDEDEGAIMDLGPSSQRFEPGFNELPNAPSNFQNPEIQAFSGMAPSEETNSFYASAETAYSGGFPISDEPVDGPSPYAMEDPFNDFSAPMADTVSYSNTELPSSGFASLGDVELTPVPTWQASITETADAEQPFGEAYSPVQSDWGNPMPQVSPQHSPQPSAVPEMLDNPELEVHPTPRLEQSWYSEDVLGASTAPDMQDPSWAPIPLDVSWTPEEPVSLQPFGAASESNAFAAEEEESDFYATAFTLNEQGELVPVHDEELFSELEAAAQQQVSIMQSSPEFEPMAPPALPEVSAPAWVEPNLDSGFTMETVAAWGNDVSFSPAVPLVPPSFHPEVYEVPIASENDQPKASPQRFSEFQAAPELPPSLAMLPAAGLAAAALVSSFGPSIAPVSPTKPAEAVPVNNLDHLLPPAVVSSMPKMPTSAPEQFIGKKRLIAQSTVPPAPLSPSRETAAPQPQPQAPRPSQPNFQVQQPSLPPSFAVPEAATPAEPPQTIRPKPLTRKPGSQAPAEDLESQWYVPEAPDQLTGQPVAQSASQAASMKLTLGNLEVMGICQLSSEKRLLVIHNAGVYALMAQSGHEEPDVTVLKVFEHNPLAYQHTFTAVAEGEAGGQGMYVTQVGTWHAIISTFQDKISLHTELG